MINEINDKIYNRLKQSEGEFVPSSKLTGELNLSRMTVSLRIAELKSMGMEIESRTNCGYKLLSDKALNEYSLKRELSGRGVNLIYRESGDTTFSVKTDKPTAFVVFREQTGGKGRRGRAFVSSVGGVYMSYVFCPKNITIDKITGIVLLSGVAAARALKPFGVDIKLKWPNDLHYNGLKVGGILCESELEETRVTRVNVGVGINVENVIGSELKDVATNLFGLNINQNELASRFEAEIRGLIARAENGEMNSVLDEYRLLSDTLGKNITVTRDQSFDAKAIGITGEGYLLIERDGKTEAITYGDVSVREKK